MRCGIAFAIIIALSPLSACHWFHRAETSDDVVTVVADTVRGIVRVVGAMPFPQVIISQAGQRPIAVAGSQLELLKGLSGVEVMASGKLTADMNVSAAPRGAPVFDVARFEVRAVDGIVAYDGILEEANGASTLRLSNGVRTAIRNLPPALRDMNGARVYLVGPLDRAPAAYGIIARAP